MTPVQNTPGGPVPLEAVISTEELYLRVAHPPDFKAVADALVALAQTMADSPETVLQHLVETGLSLCHAHSAGISLLEEENGQQIFRWHAVAGEYAPHLWGTTPRNFSPCGTVLDTDKIQLMSHLHRHFTYFAEVLPHVTEALLVPFHVGGEAVGTVWIVSHDQSRKFDSEDVRVMTTLGNFAAAAYQTLSGLIALKAIIATIREPLLVLDGALRVKTASRAFYETFQAAPEDTLKKSFVELCNHQWDIPELRSLLAEVLPKDKRIEDYELEHEVPNHGRRTMLLNARRLQQGDRKEPLLLLAIEDITERKLAVDTIRENERRRREIFEALPTAVYTTDSLGRITMFNKAAVEFSGRVPELNSDSWCVSWKMYWPDGTPLPHEQCPMAIALKENRPVRGVEAIAERPDGTRINFVAYPTPLYDSAGRLTGGLNMLVDITERKKIEKERLELLAKERAFDAELALQEAQAELAHVARALTVGELATSIAHEVNQPLAAIVTNAEACLRWLSGKAPSLREAEESLALIVRDGNRASEVIRRIREFLKKDSQQYEMLDINNVVKEAVALGRAELTKGQVGLRIELSNELPPVRGDRIQLQQVILNLMMNGREAMASIADRPRELSVISGKSGLDSIVVAVRDSGAGIEGQKVDQMFDAFFTTKPTGLGMGLSISRSIIEAHGGRIWAALNEDQGLTVQFSLPAGGEYS